MALPKRTREDNDTPAEASIVEEEPSGNVMGEEELEAEIRRLADAPASWASLRHSLLIAESIIRASLPSQPAKALGNAGANEKAAIQLQAVKDKAWATFDGTVTDFPRKLARLVGLVDSQLQDVQDFRIPQLMRTFWRDSTLLLKNRGCRDLLSKTLVLNLGANMLKSLAKNETYVVRSFGRMVEVCLRNEGALETIPSLLLAIHMQNKQGSNLLEDCLKTLFNKISAFGTKRLSEDGVDNLRKAMARLVIALNQIQKTRAKVVYRAGFRCLRMLSLAAHLSAPAHGKRSKTNEEAWLRSYSWGTLAIIRCWVMLAGAEESDLEVEPDVEGVPAKKMRSGVAGQSKIANQTEACGKDSLKNLCEGWSLLLSGLIRRAMSMLTYSPFLLKAYELQLLIMRVTRMYVPVGVSLMTFAHILMASTANDPGKAALARAGLKIDKILVLERTELNQIKVIEDLNKSMISVLIEYFKLLSHHPSFPEVSSLPLHHLKTLIKNKTANKRNVSLPGHKNSFHDESTQIRLKIKSLVKAVEDSAHIIRTLREDLLASQIPSSLFIFTQQQYNTFPIAQVT